MNNIVKESKNTINPKFDIDELYPEIFYVDRCLCAFVGRYFVSDDLPKDEESLNKRLLEYISNYEAMAAELWMISHALFDIRVKSEFMLGVDSPVTRARARYDLAIMRRHKELWDALLQGMSEEHAEKSSAE